MNAALQAPGSPPLPGLVPLFATTRGHAGADIVECVQYGAVAVVDPHGRVRAAAGDPFALHYARSTLKPLQALPFVEDGGLGHYGFGSHELAMLCSSHNGEAVHVALVRRILARVGAREADLQCGSHPPRYYEVTGEPRPPGLPASPLFHNCSGKHSGFLAYCSLHGHARASYLDPDAPLQTRIRNALQDCVDGDAVVAGTDGCNAPNYALPLARLAQLYARIATSDDGAWRALYYAMTRHPDLVSGTGRTDLDFMRTGGGDWVSKIGADGLQTIGVRSQGLGIAVRVASGSARATHLATVEVLHQIGLLDRPQDTPLAAALRPAERNTRGLPTGRTVPLFTLPRLVG